MKKLSTILPVIFVATMFSSVVAEEKAVTDQPKSELQFLFRDASLEDFDFFLVDGGKKEDVFKIEDNILKITGSPFGWLATKKSYKNFFLFVEIRHPNPEEIANSGLFLRLTENVGTFLPKCIEIQMHKKTLGDIFGFHGVKLCGSPDRFAFVEEKNLHKVVRDLDTNVDPNEWTRVAVLCHEDIIVVYVNDQVVNWAWNVDSSPGQIAFQSEGGEIWFRNARILEK
ncbi:MAG: DUF1080 domain-containing protein [Planctomycetia bacterium]|nr:DUF1080 domain-containing protein [Planctomycetia bacterium]